MSVSGIILRAAFTGAIRKGYSEIPEAESRMTTPASDVDVSPMVFTEFVCNGRRYRTDRPLVFTFEYAEEDGVGIYLFEGEYNIISGAHSREEAGDMIDDTLDFLWREYAEISSVKMTLGAKALGQDLRRRFQLVTDGS
jgi:hypothetical protein